MAELTVMEEKLAEVLGLARAAVEGTRTVRRLTEDAQLRDTLEGMGEEARETASRCEEVAGERTGHTTAIVDLGRSTKAEATEMMATYLGDDADALDGLEFMVMAEAGEVGHWEVLLAMAESADDRPVIALAEWALPIQERHLATARAAAVGLAADRDPMATA